VKVTGEAGLAPWNRALVGVWLCRGATVRRFLEETRTRRGRTVTPRWNNGGESSRGSEGLGPVTVRQPAALRHRWQRQER